MTKNRLYVYSNVAVKQSHPLLGKEVHGIMVTDNGIDIMTEDGVICSFVGTRAMVISHSGNKEVFKCVKSLS